MAVLAFVTFWVLVAIGLVYLGIRSNRKSGSDVDSSRSGRALWFVGFGVVVLAFGVGLPIVSSIGRVNDSERIPAADISELTTDQEHGRELFGKYCRQCHMLEAASAVAQVGPSLDTLRPTRELVLDAIENGRARGNGAMAADLVQGKDAQDVADFVAVAVGKAETPEG